ncbi:MAG: hypothetical protein OXF60_00680 [Gammaproteobacteria bacterium]|nr:hypothetical protein [Gammaproteobacteria bacterium]MCY4218726.1 hypothetical protein [Gammaproteobacteria bacterium]
MSRTLNSSFINKGWALLLFAFTLSGCSESRIGHVEITNSDLETKGPSVQSDEPLESTSKIFKPLQNAKFDLGLALATNSEWMVHEESISSHPVSLSEILLTAEQHYENDNLIEGERLSLLISKFARLAFQQHILNQQYFLNGKNLYSQ